MTHRTLIQLTIYWKP